LINRLDVWRAWISPQEMLSDDQGTMARWHIYWIACEAEDVDRMRAELKPWRWYAHFWRGNSMIVIFHDARFDAVDAAGNDYYLEAVVDPSIVQHIDHEGSAANRQRTALRATSGPPDRYTTSSGAPR
jgi:hypothetical protein